MKLFDVCRAIVAAGALLAPSIAHADLTMTVMIKMDMSKMTIDGHVLSSSELAQIQKSAVFGGGPGGAMYLTTFQSGTKSKTVAPLAISVSDTATKTISIIMPSLKQYMTLSLDQLHSIMKSTGSASSMNTLEASTQANLLDTKKTTTILGHEVHLYKVFVKNSGLTILGSASVAPDLPPAPSFAMAGKNPMLDVVNEKMHGAALKMTCEMLMPKTIGRISMLYVVTAIASQPIAPSVFDIPTGYTQMQTPGAAAATSPPPAPATPAPAAN